MVRNPDRSACRFVFRKAQDIDMFHKVEKKETGPLFASGGSRLSVTTHVLF